MPYELWQVLPTLGLPSFLRHVLLQLGALVTECSDCPPTRTDAQTCDQTAGAGLPLGHYPHFPSCPFPQAWEPGDPHSVCTGTTPAVQILADRSPSLDLSFLLHSGRGWGCIGGIRWSLRLSPSISRPVAFSHCFRQKLLLKGNFPQRVGSGYGCREGAEDGGKDGERASLAPLQSLSGQSPAQLLGPGQFLPFISTTGAGQADLTSPLSSHFRASPNFPSCTWASSCPALPLPHTSTHPRPPAPSLVCLRPSGLASLVPSAP